MAPRSRSWKTGKSFSLASASRSASRPSEDPKSTARNRSRSCSSMSIRRSRDARSPMSASEHAAFVRTPGSGSPRRSRSASMMGAVGLDPPSKNAASALPDNQLAQACPPLTLNLVRGPVRVLSTGLQDDRGRGSQVDRERGALRRVPLAALDVHNAPVGTKAPMERLTRAFVARFTQGGGDALSQPHWRGSAAPFPRLRCYGTAPCQRAGIAAKVRSMSSRTRTVAPVTTCR
jgi:hypothetical protein